MTGVETQDCIRVEAQAMAWWRKLQHGTPCGAELEEFGAWMATPAHAVAYADCEWSATCLTALDEQGDPQWTAWKDNAMQRAREATPKVEPLANWSDLVFARAPRPHRYQGIRFFLKHALPLAACLVLVFALFSWQRPEATTVLHYQADNATRQILLPDGTYLTLDAGTAVDYMEVGGVRRLQLPTGRVYLRVAKDPEGSRFVVQSGEVETVVLGTRFQVHQIAGRTDVVLEEGRVRMRRPGTELAAMLAPGERGWWTTGAVAFHKTAANPAKAMAWMRGRLLFEDVPLAKAVAEVNRYSKDVRIELADPRLEQLRVSGSYLAGDAELVVAAWEATLPVRARHHDGRITLTRE